MRQKIKSTVILIILILVLVFPLSACEDEEIPSDNPLITITLESGELIKLELYPDIAPVTVENFLKYVNDGFYDNTIFHRIIAGFMIQGGGYTIISDSLRQKTPTYEPITGEFSENGYTQNTLKHAAGVISMARTSVANSGTSQFFICTDMKERQAEALDGMYAAFGRVTDSASLNVVRRLANVDTSTYYNEGIQPFEDFPVEPVKIVSAIQTNRSAE